MKTINIIIENFINKAEKEGVIDDEVASELIAYANWLEEKSELGGKINGCIKVFKNKKQDDKQL